MNLTVTANGDGIALEHLYHWLMEDATFVRSGDPSLRSAGGRGHMGALEIIDVTLTHVTGLAALAIAYANWRNSRDEAPEITITAGDVSIAVNDASPETIELIIAALTPRIVGKGTNPRG